MLKSYNQKDSITEEELLSDIDFIRDAGLFLRERDGIEEPLSAQDTYDKFMEHMRYQNVNEVTALRDLEYAQNADLEGKQRFARLIDVYDKTDTSFGGKMMFDYIQGVATAPSTYLGLATGGFGKAASVAGTQAAKVGLRTVLSKTMREATKTAGRRALAAGTVEATIGAGQAMSQEQVRVETGLQDKIDAGNVALTAGISGVTGGLLSFPVAKRAITKGKEADELYEAAQFAAAEKANKASEATARVLKENSQKDITRVQRGLNQLDPTKVAIGRKLKQDLQPGETMEAALGSDVFRNITAATLQVSKKLQLKKGERITEGITRLIKNGELDVKDIRNIMDEHNLTLDQFSLVYYAEMSEAGRTLAQASIVKRAVDPKLKSARDVVDGFVDDLDKLNEAGVSPLSGKEARRAVVDAERKHYIKDLDSLRLGLMTSQLATTMRNNINGGFRIGIDATTRAFDNVLNLRNPLDGTFDVAKYAFNPQEASVIRQIYTDAFPEEAAKLFREAADLSAVTSSETVLAKIGRKANFLNTASDNFFKSAVMAASLRRRLSDSGADLNDIIRKGEFNRIDTEIMQGAIDDAYEFTYQSNFKGNDKYSKVVRGFLNAHQDFPFLISTFMPFPRFIANQLKFIYQHAPLMSLANPLDQTNTSKKLARQMTGMAMLGTALAWRVKQGETNNWYEIKTNDGKIVDGRPVYGPFAPFMLAADLMYRGYNGTLPTSGSKYFRDASQALLGSTFRTGFGLYMLDQLWTDVGNQKTPKVIGEAVGNLINTYTLPLSVVKDFYAPFDPESRFIPETRTGEADEEVSFFKIIYETALARGTRALPDTAIGGYERPARSPFQTGPLKAVDSVEKQLFGMGKRPQKTLLQKEMARLNIDTYELYKRQPNDKLDMYIRQELSREDGALNLTDTLENVILGETYQNKNIPERRQELSVRVKKLVEKAKERATSRMEREAAEAGEPFTSLDLTAWERTPKNIKDIVQLLYEEKYGGGGSIIAERGNSIAVRGRDMNVLRWAVETANNEAVKTGGVAR
tara:strand:- start:16060 stop:19164 length:3105 start_codon:yes stop_codon:yes gene_type:complete